MHIEEFAGYLKKVKRKPQGGYTALCPAHDYHNPSLSVNEGNEGQILVKCFKGCTFEEIAASVGLQQRDFFAKNSRAANGPSGTQLVGRSSGKRAKTISAETVARLHRAHGEPDSREYLYQRGLTDKTIDDYQLGQESSNGELRTTIPVLNENGEFEDIRLWLPPFLRNGSDSAKIRQWKSGYGAPRLYPYEQLKAERLVFCEGEMDALAAISHGIPAITLTAGVSTAPTRTQAQLFGGKRVVVLMDHDDAGTIGANHRAAALASYADVLVAHWPPGRSEGWDVTDELVHHGVASLQAIIDAAVPYEPSPTAQDIYPFAIRDGCLGWMKPIGRGDDMSEVFVRLCNFVARVTKDCVHDNGVEKSRVFSVELQIRNGPKHLIEVSSDEFTSMKWIVREAGVRARITAGAGTQDKLREAIQTNSPDVTTSYAFGHTGWREVDGRKIYLHAGRNDVTVQLDAPLNRYALPEQPSNIEDTLHRSLALLDTTDDEITIPLLAAMYLAPLCEILQLDFSLFLVGKSGSLKSTLAALFLCHYGDVPDKTALPASWESTDNALERRLSTLKDVPCVIDDYAPGSDAYAQRKQAQRAARILRSVGNRSGRSRLRSDLSERPEYIPRGLLISTGEDLPPGQSILARTLTLPVEKKLIDMAALTEAQETAETLPHALAAYIEWLEPQLGELGKTLPKQWHKHRTSFEESRSHLRLPETLAHLALGIDLLTAFAADRGILKEPEIEQLASRTLTALTSLGLKHGQRVQEEDAAEIFLRTLKAMLAQGTATLISKTALPDGNGVVGWSDGTHALLIPEAARQAVARYLRESDNHFPYSARALNEALEARGVLTKDAQGKLSRLVKIHGKTRRVLQIPINLLTDDDDAITHCQHS